MKERQEIYNANQRELNSLQLELVKSDNEFLYDNFFFMEAMSFALVPTGMIINNSHNFGIWKCYSKFNQWKSIRTKWEHNFAAIPTRSDLDYTKLYKLPWLDWQPLIFRKILTLLVRFSFSKHCKSPILMNHSSNG